MAEIDAHWITDINGQRRLVLQVPGMADTLSAPEAVCALALLESKDLGVDSATQRMATDTLRRALAEELG